MIQSQNFQRHDVMVLVVIPKVSPVPGDTFHLLSPQTASRFFCIRLAGGNSWAKGFYPPLQWRMWFTFLHHHGSEMLVVHLSVSVLFNVSLTVLSRCGHFDRI